MNLLFKKATSEDCTTSKEKEEMFIEQNLTVTIANSRLSPYRHCLYTVKLAGTQ